MEGIFNLSESICKYNSREEELILDSVKKEFKGKEFYCLRYSVVAFKNIMNTFKDFYYITESTLIEKEIFDQLIVLDAIDISNKYLDCMVQVNNSHTVFTASDQETTDEDFIGFLDNINNNYYENYREFKIEEEPEKQCLYRIVATSNFCLDDFTESVIADNMKLHIAMKFLPTLLKYFGEDSQTHPRIKPVTYKPFIWTP